jgi:hypothetical protein
VQGPTCVLNGPRSSEDGNEDQGKGETEGGGRIMLSYNLAIAGAC